MDDALMPIPDAPLRSPPGRGRRPGLDNPFGDCECAYCGEEVFSYSNPPRAVVSIHPVGDDDDVVGFAICDTCAEQTDDVLRRGTLDALEVGALVSAIPCVGSA